jgi:hypothetical protein
MTHTKSHRRDHALFSGVWPLSQRTAYALFWVGWGALLGGGIGHEVGEAEGLVVGSVVGGVTFGLISWAWTKFGNR